MRRLTLFAALALLLPASALGDGPTVRASHVWIREAPPGISVLAGYFTLENLTGAALDLTGVSSPDFGSAMLHETVEKDGTGSMREVAKLTIPARGRVEFKPGGYHVMLMQPRKNMFSGDLVTLVFSFSDGSQLTLIAPVRREPPAS
jgi:copper(I)-binding protein